MKVVLVTSQITFVPGNYLDALAGAAQSGQVAGVILLSNFSPRLLVQAAGLYALGCREFSKTLLKNAIGLRQDLREEYFKNRNIPVLRFESMNQPEAIDWVRSNEIDLLVNMRTRCIYRSEILRAPRLGCINVHHGLLPEMRGTMCDLYALANSQPAGFSIHQMTEKIDAGRILKTVVVSDREKNYMSYLKNAASQEGKVLGEFIAEVARANALPEGIENRSDRKIYRKNPSAAVIRRMLQNGMVL